MKNSRFFFISILIAMAFLLTNLNFSWGYENEIRNISSVVGEKIAKMGKKTVAVVDFTDLQGNVTELGRFLAEELSVALSEAGKGFEVVDRTHLKTLLKEHQLAQTGLIDPKTARKLGEIAGVQGLITGTITPFGDSIRLAVKVLETETAKVIAGSRADIAKTKAIEELLARGIETTTTITSEGSSTPSLQTKNPALKKDRAVDVGRFIVEVESLKIMADGGLMVALAYINQGKEDLQIIIQDRRNAFASDGINEYRLERSSGISDIIIFGGTTTFLSCPPGKRAKASYFFRRTMGGFTEKEFEKIKLAASTVSIGHQALATKNLDIKKPEGGFGFSATISNVNPD